MTEVFISDILANTSFRQPSTLVTVSFAEASVSKVAAGYTGEGLYILNTKKKTFTEKANFREVCPNSSSTNSIYIVMDDKSWHLVFI